MIDEEKKLTQIAIKFLSFRPRLTIEVVKRLQKDSKNNSLINQIIIKLEKSGFLNDLQFIENYINFHASVKLQGPLLIRVKLLRLGAKADLLNSTLRRLLSPEVEFSLIRQLAAKKSPHRPLNYPDRAKLSRFLSSRGFRLEAITRVID